MTAKSKLSETYLAQGKYNEAVGLAEEVLKGRERSGFGEIEKKIAIVAYNLYRIYLAAGKDKEAKVLDKKYRIVK